MKITVNTKVRHDGVQYPAGTTLLGVTEKEAARFRELGVIAEKPQAESKDDLESMQIGALRKLATDRDIDEPEKQNKKDLIEALAPKTKKAAATADGGGQGSAGDNTGQGA